MGQPRGPVESADAAATNGVAEYPATLDACHRLIDQLRAAVESRDVIGQAKGVLMARENISEADAFMVLVRASQRGNRKLRDVASGVVAVNTERSERFTSDC